jgi:hypothetical protein
MDEELDSVYRKFWMQKGDCNIFLIGEGHARHTRCKSIYDMFGDLLADNRRLTPPVKFDLLLEDFSQDRKKNFIFWNRLEHQMNVVRTRFKHCMHKHTKKPCDVRVHWVDSTEDSESVPKWISNIGKARLGIEKDTGDWKAELQSKDDVLKLVTLNRKVMKEIQKASEVNPVFNQAFVLDMFQRLNEESMSPTILWAADINSIPRPIFYDYDPWSGYWKGDVFYFNRNVIDIYTIARLIKSKMKHVIIYAGFAHTCNCYQILLSLGFQVKMERVGSPKCDSLNLRSYFTHVFDPPT